MYDNVRPVVLTVTESCEIVSTTDSSKRMYPYHTTYFDQYGHHEMFKLLLMLFLSFIMCVCVCVCQSGASCNNSNIGLYMSIYASFIWDTW
jgi:hypothetical protein